jgi:Zn-dependent protease with chaperone function
MRLPVAITALTLALAAAVAPAQESKLPDIGSSANELLNPAKQAEYGSMMLAQLRHYGYILDDPLIDGWLQSVGHRLAASSDKPQQPFTFFLMRDRQFNAFATLGGYVGANAGMVLAAESEDEVAGVLAHEVAHVTQTHVLRAAERAQKDSVPILLAMLGAIAVAQSAGGNSSGNASMAALASAQALMQQRQIDYTRSNESEADRLGIQTLVRAGYDPQAMVSMFERMQSISRVNQAASASARRATCRPTRSPPPASAKPRRAPTRWRRSHRRSTPAAASAPTRCCRLACGCPAPPAAPTPYSSAGRANASASSVPTHRWRPCASTRACAGRSRSPTHSATASPSPMIATATIRRPGRNCWRCWPTMRTTRGW